MGFRERVCVIVACDVLVSNAGVVGILTPRRSEERRVEG